jgi:hypothetical protein
MMSFYNCEPEVFISVITDLKCYFEVVCLNENLYRNCTMMLKNGKVNKNCILFHAVCEVQDVVYIKLFESSENNHYHIVAKEGNKNFHILHFTDKKRAIIKK